MPRRAQIDRAAVVTAGLGVADDGGLGAVTMQAIASRLGVTTMALYRHVRSKDDLLDAMVEGLLDEIGPIPDGLDWQGQLAALAAQLRDVARRHPAVFPLLLQVPARTERAIRTRERVYDVLRAAGVREAEIERLERIVSTIALGYAASEAAGRFRHHPPSVIDEDFEALGRLLADGLRSFVGPPPTARRGRTQRIR